MSVGLHLASKHSADAIASRVRLTEGASVDLANVGTSSSSQTRVVLMRRGPIGESRHTRLHGLFSTGSTLMVVFWTTPPLPSTAFGVDTKTYHINPADVEACLSADVWGHEILGYIPVPAGSVVEVLQRQRQLTVDNFAGPETLRDLLTNLCAPGSEIHELATLDHTPAVLSNRVLLIRWSTLPELETKAGWDPALRVRDSERVIYSVPATRLQEMMLTGAPLGVLASSLAEDLDDPNDVLMAASRMYRPTSGSPYRWFQVAMNDARRLGVKVR